LIVSRREVIREICEAVNCRGAEGAEKASVNIRINPLHLPAAGRSAFLFFNRKAAKALSFAKQKVFPSLFSFTLPSLSSFS